MYHLAEKSLTMIICIFLVFAIRSLFSILTIKFLIQLFKIILQWQITGRNSNILFLQLQVFQKRNVDPPDLVTSPKRRKSRVNYKRVLVASAVCVPVGVALYYNKDNVINHFHRIFSFT